MRTALNATLFPQGLPETLADLKRLPALPLNYVLAVGALPPDHPVYAFRRGLGYILCRLDRVDPTAQNCYLMPYGGGPLIYTRSKCVFVPLAGQQDI